MLMGVGFTEEQSIMLIMILHNMAYAQQPGTSDDQVRMVYRKVQSKMHNKEQEEENIKGEEQ